MSFSVEKGETEDLLRSLIQAGSENPPGDVQRCAGVVTRLLDREGISYQIKESKPGVQNICAHLPGADGDIPEGKTFLFSGHLDTVPVGTGWSVDPFAAEIKGNYMYGRGATDMKAGLAASLMALVGLKRQGCPFAGNVIYTAVGDEEYHGQYGTKWLLSKGLTADMAVCCEPTNLDLCLGNRGLLMIDVVVKGKSSHGGRPNLGKNAISIAAKIVNQLEQIVLESHRNGHFTDPVGSLSVVGMHGGDRINVIPDRCVLYLDRRMMPGESSDEAIDQIEKAITAATGVIPAYAPDNNSEILVKPEVWHEPFWMPETHAYVSRCIEIFVSCFGTRPAIEGKSAGTDASHLVSMGKIPTVIFGPGDYRESHTVDEKVDLLQLDPAMNYYSQLVKTLLNAKEC